MVGMHDSANLRVRPLTGCGIRSLACLCVLRRLYNTGMFHDMATNAEFVVSGP